MVVELGGEVEDYVLMVDCGILIFDFVDYIFDCGLGKEVDLYGVGVENDNVIIVSIFSFGNVFQYVVEVIYKGGSLGIIVFFMDVGGNVYFMIC